MEQSSRGKYFPYGERNEKVYSQIEQKERPAIAD